MHVSRPFINILISSTVMCLVYTAFFPGVGIQEAVLEDAEPKLGTIVGFISQGITYLSSVLVAISSPLLIGILGTKPFLVGGALLYGSLFVSWMFLKAWLIYLGSALAGIGMGILWVVAPKIVADNSSERTLQRNTSIFWCIYMMSMVIGNLANYLYLGKMTSIGTTTRFFIYGTCCGVIAISAIVALGYRHISHLDITSMDTTTTNDELLTSRSLTIPVHPDLKFTDKLKMQSTKYLNLVRRRSVAYLLILLCFNGVTLSFYTLTFQACLSNTFAQRSIIPLMQLILGTVEVFGAIAFERLTAKIGNKISVMILYVITLSTLMLVFLSFAPDSPHKNAVDSATYITPTTTIVIVIAIMIAIFDLGYNILANYMVALLFLSDSEVGYGILNSSMSLITGSIFFLSSFLGLYVILGVLLLFSTAATVVIVFDLALRNLTPVVEVEELS